MVPEAVVRVRTVFFRLQTTSKPTIKKKKNIETLKNIKGAW